MKNHNPFRYFTTSPEIIRLAVPYNQMGLINVGACLLHAPATKQIQVDSIFAVKSKLRQLRAPATIKTLPSLPLDAAVLFCWVKASI